LHVACVHWVSGDENKSAVARVFPLASSPPTSRMPEEVSVAVAFARVVDDATVDHWPVTKL
jgi:hypothetical protein